MPLMMPTNTQYCRYIYNSIILIHAGHSVDPQHSRPWDVLIHGRWYIPLATDIHTSPRTSEVVSYKKKKKAPLTPMLNAKCLQKITIQKWFPGFPAFRLPDLASLPEHL